MPITVDLDGLKSSQLVVRPHALTEMMALLHALTEQSHHRERSRELSSIERRISPSLRKEIGRYSPLWARFRIRALMPLSHSEVHLSPESEIAELQDLSTAAFSTMVSEAVAGRRLPPHLIGDPAADEFLEICRRRSEQSFNLAKKLVDPECFKHDFLEFVSNVFDDFFGMIWNSVFRELRPEVAETQALLNKGNLNAVFSSISPQAYFIKSSSKLVFDKLQDAVVDTRDRTIVLVPSNWATPHITVKYDKFYGGTELPIVICYPVIRGHDTSQNLSALQERMQVLSDPSRSDLIRHLVSEACTTSDLASRTGMTRPQVSRHLGKLRDVGLLGSKRHGRHVKHRLKTEMIYQVGVNFVRTLTR